MSVRVCGDWREGTSIEHMVLKGALATFSNFAAGWYDSHICP
jgi:hypothetical protein